MSDVVAAAGAAVRSELTDTLDLLDWKRRVFALYAEIRGAADPVAAWLRWREVRDDLFRDHPQSPLDPAVRVDFPGLPCFDYDPTLRVSARLLDTASEPLPIGTSAGTEILFRPFATARFELGGQDCGLQVFWLEGYGGGVFLPFCDSTSGSETYGGGRYLLDSVKGADLGAEGGRLLLDFNFAYNPSCSYDDRWVCPLAPPANTLDLPVRGGERRAEPAPGRT